ncbi:hypothetical protein ACIP39_29085 [Streptomyces tibetensis]|uniref:hypothetical protein n=1 Tax=Streptomyces tibetensis TaxID=2382123 RepID=UPI00382CCACD
MAVAYGQVGRPDGDPLGAGVPADIRDDRKYEENPVGPMTFISVSKRSITSVSTGEP